MSPEPMPAVPAVRCVGVDFDNTLVCCDAVFFTVGQELGFIPSSVAPSKDAIRTYIKDRLTNDEWTLLQAEVYGPRLREAEPYPGAVDFLAGCRDRAVPVLVISHKGRYDAAGKGYDLHESARRWLRRNGLLDAGVRLTSDDVTFATSRRDKIEQIRQRGCDLFIDDLPEVFEEPGFPETVRKVLFDPHDARASWHGGFRATSWDVVRRHVLGDAS